MNDLRVLRIDEGQRQPWNSFVARSPAGAPAFVLMQSYEWGQFKESLGWKAIRLAAQRRGQIVAAAQLLVKSAPLGLFSVGYVPRGPLVDWDDTATTAALLQALHREARRHRAIFLKIEPALLHSSEAQEMLSDYGFRASSYTNQPRATIVLDLTQDLDDILKQMHKTTRYNIRYAARKGVAVRVGSKADLTILDQLMQITGRRAGFTPRKMDYYERQWEVFAPLGQIQLLVATYEGKALAVSVDALLGECAADLHIASSNEHKNLKSNHLLTWEAIKWAKSQNCRTFDLWGIPEEVGLAVYEGKGLPTPDRTDGLWGVYRFKRGFCKNVVLYVSAHDYVYSPPFYPVVTSRFLNMNVLDRIAVWMDRLRYA